MRFAPYGFRAATGGVILFLLWLAVGRAPAQSAATNSLSWDREQMVVSADVRDWGLLDLLESVAAQSGWHVFVEPDENYSASVKFNALPVNRALRRLLGDLNFAVLPQTNGPTHLYVFRTGMKNATQQVRSVATRKEKEPRRIPNELIVRVKPGTDIEALAKSLGAKVVGRIPELNAYRLQFEDEEAMEAAREKLLANPDVLGVEYNYYVDPPREPQSLGGRAAPETQLKLDPPKQEDCKVVVGFVDTALPKLDPQLEQFIKDRIALAGEVPATSSLSPTHSTAMFNAYLQAMQASGRSSTSVQAIFVDVFGAGESANTFNVALGLIAAGNQGATVINASLGGYGESQILYDAVKQLAEHNIPVFAAVGNDATTTPFYPAAIPEVISVTAVDRGKIAAYANVGVAPDVAAPGAVLFSYNGLTYGSLGTSVSSAAATGVAAGLADSGCAPWSQVIPILQKNMAVPAQ